MIESFIVTFLANPLPVRIMQMFLRFKIMRSVYRSMRYVLLPFVPLYLLLFYLKKVFSKTYTVTVPVICVGNITTGGAGKTPAVMYLARLLQRAGLHPGIVSRGYGGSESKRGALVTDGYRTYLEPEQSGDEPYLISMKLRGVPVYIARRRIDAIENLNRHHDVDLVLMDDGLQNWTVYKDISVIVIDSANPFGNGIALPAGDLRETRGAIARGDIVILNRSDSISDQKLIELKKYLGKWCRKDRIFDAHYTEVKLYKLLDGTHVPVEVLEKRRVLVFSGIAHPDSFVTLVRTFNPLSIETITFPDHYHYRSKDVNRIMQLSNEYDYVITTEKDFVKLKGFCVNEKFHVMEISLSIEQYDELYRFLISAISSLLP